MVQICHMQTHCELNPYLDWANISEPPITLKHFHLELVENINFIFVGIWIFVNSSSIFALSQNAIDHLLIFFNVGCCSSRRSCDVFGWPKEAHRWKYHGSCTTRWESGCFSWPTNIVRQTFLNSDLSFEIYLFVHLWLFLSDPREGSCLFIWAMLV